MLYIKWKLEIVFSIVSVSVFIQLPCHRYLESGFPVLVSMLVLRLGFYIIFWSFNCIFLLFCTEDGQAEVLTEIFAQSSCFFFSYLAVIILVSLFFTILLFCWNTKLKYIQNEFIYIHTHRDKVRWIPAL